MNGSELLGRLDGLEQIASEQREVIKKLSIEKENWLYHKKELNSLLETLSRADTHREFEAIKLKIFRHLQIFKN